ncbi:MAG: UDP-N-acetylglucosamine 1-carboxyvinyltransferase [Acidimicrobiia bacterium]|nr:UDP-N-acetylglucosamine 1-carboxyvinyltransferase [Acidimicrobiia bacterium]
MVAAETTAGRLGTGGSILVRPGGPLSGAVTLQGAKNSVLKLLAATTLAEGTTTLRNVPAISDVESMGDLLVAMGAEVGRPAEGTLVVRTPADLVPEAPYELVERMRASIVVLGPLVARYGQARVSLPGGDDFGSRPIDLHVRALEHLGASISLVHGVVEARAPRGGLRGAGIVLEFPSVGATENALMAAVLARGTTVIDNAAREPEIADLAAFLNRMGARIVGAGSSTIQVEGVEELSPVEHSLIPDRIEAATFLAAVGVNGGEITLLGARADHMDLVTHKLGQMGMRISPCSEGLWAYSSGKLRSVDISTLPYPGVATDYKPLLVAMLAVADGVGIVTENIFSSGRFRYVDELGRMGAQIRTEGHHAVIRGRERLQGAPVRAHDIRAGAALVVAGLRAEGETEVTEAHHIDRGYERFVDKLRGLGADVERK